MNDEYRKSLKLEGLRTLFVKEEADEKGREEAGTSRKSPAPDEYTRPSGESLRQAALYSSSLPDDAGFDKRVSALAADHARQEARIASLEQALRERDAEIAAAPVSTVIHEHGLIMSRRPHAFVTVPDEFERKRVRILPIDKP